MSQFDHRAFESSDAPGRSVITDDYVAIAMAPWAAGFPADSTSPEHAFERGRAWATAVITANDLVHHGRPDLAAEAMAAAERVGGPLEDPSRWADKNFIEGVNAQLALALRHYSAAIN